jgi:hypothetical protein
MQSHLQRASRGLHGPREARCALSRRGASASHHNGVTVPIKPFEDSLPSGIINLERGSCRFTVPTGLLYLAAASVWEQTPLEPNRAPGMDRARRVSQVLACRDGVT